MRTLALKRGERRCHSWRLCLAIVPLIAVSACTSDPSDSSYEVATDDPTDKRSAVEVEAVAEVELTDDEEAMVCKAAIAAMNGRDPSTMSSEHIEGSLYHIAYTRPDDGTRWQNRCEITGSDTLRWAAFDPFSDGSGQGRWRTEDDVRFSLTSDTVRIRVSMMGELMTEESYPKSAF